MPDIIALGEPMIEFNEEADGRYRQGFGGDTSNAAIAAARLGASVRYVTLVGKDRFGDLFMELWAHEGIDTQFVGRHGTASTGAYIVNRTPSGHAFTYLRAGSAASLMTPADVPAAALAASKFLHISAISQAISPSARETVAHAMAQITPGGAALSYDTNLRLQLWSLADARATIEATAAQANIVKTSIEDARLLTGLETPGSIAKHYLSMGPSVVIVTLGGEGVLIATPHASWSMPAHMVRSVDATGAGDAFAGAFLAEYASRPDPESAARFANAAAALATTGYGAVAPLPTREAVLALLRTA